MSNSITYRISQFLKGFPPFEYIEDHGLLKIAESVVTTYFENGEVIFRQGDKAKNIVYVVRSGAVELTEQLDGHSSLHSLCDSGDIFGIRPLVKEHGNYSLTAIAKGEALIYQVSASNISSLIDSNRQVAGFFATTFRGGFRKPASKLADYKAAAQQEESFLDSSFIPELHTIDIKRPPVTCNAGDTIKTVAGLMKQASVGSIIVTKGECCPIGIITDRDLRNKIVAEGISLDSDAAKIMSSPVITEQPFQPVGKLYTLMLKNNIRHICITEDGSPGSKIVGVISEHDIVVSHGHSPSALLREILSADSPAQLISVYAKVESLLKNYLQQEVSAGYISSMISEINSSLTTKAIDFSIKELEKDGKLMPKVKWCWLAIGSQGRGEQLIKSDLDNAIVFHVEDNNDPKNYFVELGSRTNKILEKCGFQLCPSNMMAGNPDWCLPVNQWQDKFDDWIFSPGEKEVMHASIFFDFNPVAGDFELAETLGNHIKKSMARQESFLSFLAKSAIQNPPPLSFFKNIMVEQNGEHRDEFDIKARAMMPLVDGARVLALASGILQITNTAGRFRKLSALEPENKMLFELLAGEYEILMRFRAIQGLKHNNSGRYFSPGELNKLQRIMLRNCFEPIKQLQSLLKVRFNLQLFR